MIPTYEQREARYQGASSLTQNLYAGEAVGGFLRDTFEQYHLREELYYAYATAFGDAVLGFEEEARLPQLLMERVHLPEKLATLIAHDLLEFINTYKAQSQVPIPQPLPVLETPVDPTPLTPQPITEVPREQVPAPTPLPAREAPRHEPPATPAWSRFVAQPKPVSAQEEVPEDAIIPLTVRENPPEPPRPASDIPSYARPLMNAPRYQDDPYREKPE